MKYLITLLFTFALGVSAVAARPAVVVMQEIVEEQMMEAEYKGNIEQILKDLGADQTRENYLQIARVYVTHQLITSQGAVNGSTHKGDVPYYWNFIDPNPRYSITKDNKSLHSIPATTRAHCFAHQDRTPDIFLADFFSDEKYYHPDYGYFSTFGWCAEREMAYGVLLGAFNIPSRIIAPGAHSWSEVDIWVTIYGQKRVATLIVDNTFNRVTATYGGEAPSLMGETKLQVWYNQKKNANMHLMRRILVSDQRIEELKALL
jgi:hypothetical protein